jgi:hypothetical protein
MGGTSCNFTFYLMDGVRDSITGYEGTVTARAEYKGDRKLYLVESIDSTGRPIEHWIEEDRLEHVTDAIS